METFPGGKGRSYPHLINLMPPHKVYIEPYLGSGAVVRNKRICDRTIVGDLDSKHIQRIESDLSNTQVFHTDAIELLRSQQLCQETLVYCDPPYVLATRRKSKLYRFEYNDSQHIQLLQFLVAQRCMILISGYDNPIYNDWLARWNKVHFSAQTQTGARVETAWFNYPFPEKLHDTRYLGRNFRERQNRKRRQQRMRIKVESMCPIERADLIEWIQLNYPGEIGR